MATINVSLPDPVYEKLSNLVEKDNISIDQFISLAVIEKISAMEKENLLERAEKGSREKLGEILELVPDVEVDVEDVL
jgi:metal-responsive CopG/Arc/MetJ family transcriptional regulator